MNRRLVEQALAKYGVDWAEIAEPQSGYRNQSYRVVTAGGQQLNLIFFKPEADILARIQRADAVSERAAQQGLPTRRRHDPRTLQLSSTEKVYKVFYARLYEYLPGQTILWENFGQKHIKLLGQAMSDLHHSTADLEVALPSVVKLCQALLAEMKGYFDDDGVAKAMASKLKLKLNPAVFNYFQPILAQTDNLPKQPLHLDLVRGNILFGSNDSPWKLGNLSLTGLIDFEKTARGPVIYDLARSYAFLLVDCAGKPPQKVYKYLIYSGYNKRGRWHINLSGQLTKTFFQLTSFYLLYDFYKFLLHNPYQSLADNHHFKRTRDILLLRKMLKWV